MLRHLPRAMMALAGVVFCLATCGTAWAAGGSRVTLGLDWTPLGYQAPFFSGVAKGIYAKAGLDVTVTTAEDRQTRQNSLETAPTILASPMLRRQPA